MSAHPTFWRWAVRRFLISIPVVVGVTVLTFVLVHVAPGDPVYILAGDGGSPAYYADMRAKYGLDLPLVQQFGRYARAVLTGDLGYSLTFQAPVVRVLLDHAPATVLLAAAALLLAAIAGTAAGVASALLHARALDRTMRAAASLAYAAPVFWTGQILILTVSLQLGLLPAGGMISVREMPEGLAYAADVARHLILPALALALPFFAEIARVSRAALLDALHDPLAYAVAARGFSRARVLLRHIAPAAMVPVVALVGEHATTLAAGAAVTEALFGWPGIGSLVLNASLARDYPLVTAAFVLISCAVVLFNAATDVLCAWIDPRIRLA